MQVDGDGLIHSIMVRTDEENRQLIEKETEGLNFSTRGSIERRTLKELTMKMYSIDIYIYICIFIVELCKV